MAAGAATESNLIGYVAAFPIPEVLRGINAFTLGVREVNPSAQVQVVWTSTWFDPPVEKTAAESLLDAGADVIAMHQDSAAPGQAAEAMTCLEKPGMPPTPSDVFGQLLLIRGIRMFLNLRENLPLTR